MITKITRRQLTHLINEALKPFFMGVEPSNLTLDQKIDFVKKAATSIFANVTIREGYNKDQYNIYISDNKTFYFAPWDKREFIEKLKRHGLDDSIYTIGDHDIHIIFKRSN